MGLRRPQRRRDRLRPRRHALRHLRRRHLRFRHQRRRPGHGPLLAKVLRIDVDHPDAGQDVLGAEGQSVRRQGRHRARRRGRYGLRNPGACTVDQKTGHIWVGQNGQDLWEQAYLVKKGDNYGWSVDGGQPSVLPQPQARARRRSSSRPSSITTPRPARSPAASSTTARSIPSCSGAYIYGDYSTGKIWAVKHDGDEGRSGTRRSPTRVCRSPASASTRKGELLICRPSRQGRRAASTRSSRRRRTTSRSTFPKKLSDSGLFGSVKGHVMEPALIPYSVNAAALVRRRVQGALDRPAGRRREDRLHAPSAAGTSRTRPCW